MTREEFEDIVRQTIEELPEEFLSKLDHIGFEVRDWPDRRDRRATGRSMLLGFQHGVSELERSVMRPWEPPQRIVIFQGPHERMFPDPDRLRAEIRKTVLHEIGHYFGMNEEQIRRLGYG